MSLSKESRLEKAEKMAIILILLDIIEMYSIEALEGTKQELKRAIKSAVQTNKQMTKLAGKYLGIAEEDAEGIAEHFGEAADFIHELIEAYYKNELVEDGDYIKIKVK
jgi:hypothetical protein